MNAPARAAPAGLLGRLREVVGRAHVLDDPEVLRTFVNDWTGRYKGWSVAAVRPGSVNEVAAVVGICRDLGVALVPQGGNTGLVGGGIPLMGEVLLSLRRLRGIERIDASGGQLTAAAGTTVEEVEVAAQSAGWSYGIDLASRATATLGGTVATNAGGSRVIRYGDTRRQLVGIEAVLGSGAIVSHLGGLRKDNTGYHLPSLLCGSEGTLGIVTRATVDLVPPDARRSVALLAFGDAASAIAAASSLRRGLPALTAAELFLENGLSLVCEAVGLPAPFDHSYAAYVLLESSGSVGNAEELTAALASVPGVSDAAVADDSLRAGRLWRYREAHTEAINTRGPPHKLDVALPLDSLAEFVERVTGQVTSVAPAADVWLFGHVADGNIHVNVTGVEPGDEHVDDAVLRLAAGLGGSISAEHGIGAAKRRWLALNRSDEEINAFRSIKSALDPDWVLNPNVLLPV